MALFADYASKTSSSNVLVLESIIYYLIQLS